MLLFFSKNLELLLIAYRIKYKVLFFVISNPSYASYNFMFYYSMNRIFSLVYSLSTNKSYTLMPLIVFLYLT